MISFYEARELVANLRLNVGHCGIELDLAQNDTADFNMPGVWLLRLRTHMPDTYAESMRAIPIHAARVLPPNTADSKAALLEEVASFVGWWGAHEALENLKLDGRIVYNPHAQGEPRVSISRVTL